MGKISFFSAIKQYLKGFQTINIYNTTVKLAHNQLLSGKNVVITGASRGIGKAIAKTFIESGATVVAVAKNESNLIRAKDEIRSDKYIPHVWDLSDLTDMESHMKQIEDTFNNGKIDVLVNAAGIKNGQEREYWQFSEKDFDDVIMVNIKAPFFISRYVVNHMLNNNIKGHIVNIIGIKGIIGEASPYSISKFGLSSLTKGMARMFADKGIVVNAISPGGTKTDMAGINTENYYHPATSNLRLADPQEIANIALFLASDMGNNMVGSVVVSDGGEILQYANNRF